MYTICYWNPLINLVSHYDYYGFNYLEMFHSIVCMTTSISAATPVRGAVIFHEIGDSELLIWPL